jgi:pseudouridylate synthase I
LALNGLLPEDVVIVEAQDVYPGFHARFSARAKTYHYTVYNSNVSSPFWRLYSYFTPRSLNVQAMIASAGAYEGEHDFASFQAAGAVVKNTVRTLFKVEVRKAGKLVYLTFRGNGFLYHMVRIMAGTLLEVGWGKLLPEEVEQILKACDRKLAGFTAPARGLCLEQVEYD